MFVLHELFVLPSRWHFFLFFWILLLGVFRLQAEV